jgi:hypothetical protein
LSSLVQAVERNNQPDMDTGHLLYRGLRVRMGVHTGGFTSSLWCLGCVVVNARHGSVLLLAVPLTRQCLPLPLAETKVF